MATQEILRAMSAKPFEPFRLTVADGNFCVVRHPENLAFSGKGRLIAIGMEDDSFVTLDPLLVTGLQKPSPRRTQRSRR
jgi:nucleoid-associated protein YgaU